MLTSTSQSYNNQSRITKSNNTLSREKFSHLLFLLEAQNPSRKHFSIAVSQYYVGGLREKRWIFLGFEKWKRVHFG